MRNIDFSLSATRVCFCKQTYNERDESEHKHFNAISPFLTCFPYRGLSLCEPLRASCEGDTLGCREQASSPNYATCFASKNNTLAKLTYYKSAQARPSKLFRRNGSMTSRKTLSDSRNNLRGVAKKSSVAKNNQHLDCVSHCADF